MAILGLVYKAFWPRWRRSAAQRVEGPSVNLFPRICGTEFQPHAAGADPDDGADFEQLEPDRIHLRLGPLGALQRQPPERFNQRISQRRQVQPELIALHFFGREAIGEQAHLLLDAVLHLAALALELLV